MASRVDTSSFTPCRGWLAARVGLVGLEAVHGIGVDGEEGQTRQERAKHLLPPTNPSTSAPALSRDPTWEPSFQGRTLPHGGCMPEEEEEEDN